ncbi:MAG: ATP-binding protein [Hyphomicrobiaceae bacterium]
MQGDAEFEHHLPRPVVPHAPSGLGAFELFASASTLGFVWLDRSLRIVASRGSLVEALQVGSPIVRELPVFAGVEDEFDALVGVPDKVFEVPNVSQVTAQDLEPPRLNFSVRYDAAQGLFVMMVARALSHSAPEIQLQQEVRGRVLAERLLSEQADAIRTANVELERINRKLAGFAQIVAHDLKAPMRALRYFADDLETSLSDPNSGDPRAHLERLRTQSRRMANMLTGLLAYVCLENRTAAADIVEPEALVSEIVASLLHDPAIEVRVAGDWPCLRTHRVLLDVALRNLIENAMRHAGRPVGWVEVRAERAPMRRDALLISVADDGLGIDPRWHDVIFRPFTRLEAEEARQRPGAGSTGDGGAGEGDTTEFGRLGLGLTLVQKAVVEAGASVTIESDPAVRRGTVFKLVWPGVIASSD